MIKEKKRGVQLVIYPSVLKKFKALALLKNTSLSKLLEYFIIKELREIMVAATVEDLKKNVSLCDDEDIISIDGSEIVFLDHDSGDRKESLEVDDITEGG